MILPKSQKIIGVIVFGVLLSILFLRSYSPGRSVDNFAAVAFVLLVAMTLFMALLTRANYLVISKKSFLLLVLLIISFSFSMVSSLFGPNTAAMQGVINNFFQQFLFLLLILMILSYRAWNNVNFLVVLAKLLVIFACFTALVGWQVIITGTGLWGPLAFDISVIDRFRLTSFHASSNYSGHAIALGVISALYLLNQARKAGFSFYHLIVFFLVLSLIASGSRGAFLITALAILVFYFYKNSSVLAFISAFRRRSFYISLFSISVGTALLVSISSSETFTLVENTWKRISTKTDIAELDEDARVIFLKQGLDMYLNGSFFEILFGFGNGGYVLNFGSSPHNSYLAILFEWGLMSMLMMFVVMLTVFILAKKMHTHCTNAVDKAFIFALLILILARGVFQAGELFGFGLNWIVLLAVAGIVSVKQIAFSPASNLVDRHRTLSVSSTT